MRRFLFYFLSALSITACNKFSGKKANAVVLVAEPEHINPEVAILIKTQLSDFDTTNLLVIANNTLFATNQIIELYKKNNFVPIWTNNGQHSKQCDSLVQLVKNADQYGLIANDYHLDQIFKIMSAEKDSLTKNFDAVKLAEMDMLMSDAFFTLAVHVNKGRLNPESFKREWKGNQIKLNLVDVLNEAVKNNTIHEAIDSLEPPDKQYKLVKRALAKFKVEFKNEEWESIFKLKKDTLIFNEQLKKRLLASHNYFEKNGMTDSNKLINAIKNFQFQNNLTEDGKVGELTLKALEKTKTDLIKQIELNMERWRYFNSPEEIKFVWVNIPKYEMRVFENDSLIMRSNVIVGASKTQTPILKSAIRYFIIYPYWTVPYSIATKEILPKIKRDTSYLNKQNFQILDRKNKVITTPIDWNKYTRDNFPFTLRQRIGEENSLGILKFHFENKYGVYLHDTNNHKLFGKDMRALSHGCIRLEKAVEFAEYLIREDSIKYPLDSLKYDLSKTVQKYVHIKRPIAIYVNYFTVEADKNDKLFYFQDIYRKDEKMLKALYGK